MNAVKKLIVAAVAVSAALGGAGAAAGGTEVLVCNFFADTVTRHDPVTGNRIGQLDPAGNIRGPLCAKLGPDGLLYVASEGNNSVKRFNAATGAFVDDFVAGGALTQPTGLAWDSAGNLYVGSFDQSAVLKYHGGTGAYLGQFVASGQGLLSGADNGMTFGPDGNLYVPSYNNGRIIRYNGVTGATIGTFSTLVARPRVLLFTTGALMATGESQNTVRRLNPTTGANLGNLTGLGAGGLSTPIGLALDGSGGVLVGSSGNNRVLRFDAVTGAALGTFADAADGINAPAFITVIPGPGAAWALGLGVVVAGRRRR
jgi:outer membrane protein assembly factor BamB